jgi:sec-independent protein translocase protein TatA
MFGLGVSEIVIILAVALIVLGPQKLPDLARRLGAAMREFRRATSDFQTTLHEEVEKEVGAPPGDPQEHDVYAHEPDNKHDTLQG